MRPTPQPNPCALNAAKPDALRATAAICHSAVDEQPVVPTFPLDHGWCVIHATLVIRVGEWRALGHPILPSAKNWPRSCISM